jgi:histidinol-phosphate aminotransferase
MTDWDGLARPSLRGLERYDPGPSRDTMKRVHGLDDLEPLNWNEDLFGPPQEVIDAAASELRNAAFYPERAYADFRDAVAASLNLAPGNVIPGHGIQALVGAIATAFLEPGVAVVIPELTYGLYAQVSAAAGASATRVAVRGLEYDLDAIAAAAHRSGARLIWLADPNNPTGAVVDPAGWSAFLRALPGDCVVVADEAYIDFAEPGVPADRIRDVAEGRRVIVLRSCSKIFGLAGLRLGFAIADPQVGRLLDVVQEPFNVNRVALAAGTAAMGLPEFIGRRRAEVATARDVLRAELEPAGITSYASHTNFVLIDLGTDDRPVCEALLRRGMLIRGGHEFGLPGYARVTVAPVPVMRRAAALIVAATAWVSR